MRGGRDARRKRAEAEGAETERLRRPEGGSVGMGREHPCAAGGVLTGALPCSREECLFLPPADRRPSRSAPPVGEKITFGLAAVIAADVLLRLREYVRLSYSGLG